MASNQPGETAQSTNQSSNNGGMLGGMTDKLSSAVGGGQSSPKDQSLLSQGRPLDREAHVHVRR